MLANGAPKCASVACGELRRARRYRRASVRREAAAGVTLCLRPSLNAEWSFCGLSAGSSLLRQVSAPRCVDGAAAGCVLCVPAPHGVYAVVEVGWGHSQQCVWPARIEAAGQDATKLRSIDRASGGCTER